MYWGAELQMPTPKGTKPFPNHCLLSKCFRRALKERSIAIYLTTLLLHTQVVQQLQLLLFRQERRQKLGLPLPQAAQGLPYCSWPPLCLQWEEWSTGWALDVLAIPHFSLLVFVLKNPDFMKHGKTFEILEAFRSWETSGWKMLPSEPTGGIGQCKEEIAMLFLPNFAVSLGVPAFPMFCQAWELAETSTEQFLFNMGGPCPISHSSWSPAWTPAHHHFISHSSVCAFPDSQLVPIQSLWSVKVHELIPKLGWQL